MSAVLADAGPESAPATLPDDVWIAIPAFEEARTIRALAVAALALTPAVVVVDDGSSDGTAACLEGLPVALLRHPRNLGKAASLRSAFAHALAQGAVAVVTIDGDGQHDPADAPRLVAAWAAQPERIAIGARLHDRTEFPRSRLIANRIACFWISWAAGHAIADSQSGFRVYPREVLQLALGTRVQGARFTFESEILIEAAERGHRTLALPIAARYPVSARPSHFRGAADIARIAGMVAARLLRRGLYPRGLWRSLKAR